jgi:putative SOS response-associated peptidase YedK
MMCGRLSLGPSAAVVVDLFELPEAPAWTPRYNIAPTQEVLSVVRQPDATKRQPRLLRR